MSHARIYLALAFLAPSGWTRLGIVGDGSYRLLIGSEVKHILAFALGLNVRL